MAMRMHTLNDVRQYLGYLFYLFNYKEYSRIHLCMLYMQLVFLALSRLGSMATSGEHFSSSINRYLLLHINIMRTHGFMCQNKYGMWHWNVMAFRVLL
jgi:hypothetical protein